MAIHNRGFPALVVIAATGSLAGCATPGAYNGYVNAPHADLRKVEAGGYSPAAMAQIAIVQNPDVNHGVIPVQAMKKIQTYAISCQWQVTAQIGGEFHSGVLGAATYAPAGSTLAPAAKWAFGSAVRGIQYLRYGIASYTGPGVANGVTSGSYSAASAKGSCTRDFWHDWQTKLSGEPEFLGTHVEIVYYGKAWGNDYPPAAPPLVHGIIGGHASSPATAVPSKSLGNVSQ